MPTKTKLVEDAVLVVQTSLDVSALVGHRIHGAIYNDSKMRFGDGTPVITSAIQAISVTASGVMVKTQNTTYKVVVV